MALNEIRFNCNGGPVSVEITFGFAQVGAYTLVIWNPAGTAKRMLGEGVNTDQVPDVYTLPQPITGDNGSIVDCVATILAANPGLGEHYSVDMIVRQDGAECGREHDEGSLGSKSLSTRLAAKLIC